MPETYTVLAGDHMVKIAAKFKFMSYASIWNDDANVDLRAKRKNPNILFAGDEVVAADGTTTGTPADVVTIPDKRPYEEDKLATSRKHTFLLKVDKLDLHLTLKDENDKAIGGKGCTFPTDGGTATSGDSGKLDAELPLAAELGVLQFTYKTIDLSTRGTDPDPSATPPPAPPNPDPDPEPAPAPDAKPVFPPGDVKVPRNFALAIGYLDPLEQITGVQARERRTP
jgi:hypothetical protein